MTVDGAVPICDTYISISCVFIIIRADSPVAAALQIQHTAFLCHPHPPLAWKDSGATILCPFWAHVFVYFLSDESVPKPFSLSLKDITLKTSLGAQQMSNRMFFNTPCCLDK